MRYKSPSVLSTTLGSLILVACSGGSSNSSTTPPPTPPPLEPAPEVFTGLTGVFKSVGYGFVTDIDVEANTINTFTITSDSCIRIRDPEESLAAIVEDFEIIRVDGSADEFNARSRNNTTTFSNLRQPALPELCNNGGTAPSDDPELNFDIFWQTFDEHYAFFEQREVDWAMQYELFRPQVSTSTSEEELFAILSNMVGPLADTHVSIASSSQSFNAGTTPEYIAASERNRQPAVATIIESVLDSGFVNRLDGAVRSGTIDTSIGYIAIDNFDDPDLAATIDSILSESGIWSSVIIDIRFNGGGSDLTALAVANRFTDQTRLAFSEQAVDGNGRSPLMSFELTPEGPLQFLNPVVLLTSLITASAAENFALVMTALPQTTIIGERTHGTLSTILGKVLPNGFEFGLPNEFEMAPDGTLYEVVGIPPAIEVENFTPADISNNVDSAIEAALGFLRQ